MLSYNTLYTYYLALFHKYVDIKIFNVIQNS